tara:strand:+ start:402 stop:578 length:177 start_codon:yes stop_codon:yes gene_type:complete
VNRKEGEGVEEEHFCPICSLYVLGIREEQKRGCTLKNWSLHITFIDTEEEGDPEAITI